MSDEPKNEEIEQPENGQPDEKQKFSSTGRLLTPGMGLEGELVQPKTVKKLITRFAILAAILAVLFFGMKMLLGNRDIGGLGSADTKNFIAAIKFHERGSQVVYIKPDGSIVESNSYEEGASDQEPVWSPNGNLLYFVSNREIKGVKKGANNIFRWNIGRDLIEPRSQGTRSKSTPIFEAGDPAGNAASAILTSGQTALTFSPQDGSMHQLLPPIGREVVVSDQGNENSTSAFEQIYSKFGQSFKKALLTNDGRSIVAVMRREDGEVLIAQNIAENTSPIMIAAGQYIDVEKNPANGEFYMIIHEFYIPFADQVPKEFIKNGKATYPFRHALQRFTLGSDGKPTSVVAIHLTKTDNDVFRSVKVSQDGQYLLLTAGKYQNPGSVEVNAMGFLPVQAQPGTGPSLILNGEVFEPAWSADASKVVYIKKVNGKRDIFTINRDGSSETNITNGKGDFGFPRFSPQVGN